MIQNVLKGVKKAVSNVKQIILQFVYNVMKEELLGLMENV